jgi:hypothetical protein
MRLVKYVISVSKRHENNHAGVKSGSYMIYYYDEDMILQTKRINPLLIWYYKLRKYHRKKAMCSECHRQFVFLTNWYDQKMECPVCSESITDNITVDENENEDSLGKIVSSALIGLIAMKFKQYTKFDT